jgi:tetratricopeptide (TPR) repeat protein
MERLGTISRDVYAYERLSIWKSAVQMMLDHPWFGVGLGQFEYFSPRYAFPVDAHWARFGRIAHTPHNEYLHAGAELGIPGMVLVIALIATVTIPALRAVLRSEGVDRGTLSILSAVAVVMLVHSFVDFPLHAPPLVLLLVATAAGLRVWGAEGNAWVVEFRFRRVYALAVAVLALYLAFLAARPVVAFSYYLGGIGAPRDLLREKRALEIAERKEVSNATSIAFLEKAVALDPGNATYHNALGSRYFKYYFTEDDGKLREKALFHGNFAMELNPNNHRFAYGLGQAMESLFRRYGEERFLRMAADKYRQARALAPKYYATVEKAAFIEEEIGDLAAAEQGLRSVVSLEPNYIRGWYNLAVFMAKQGRAAEAMAAIAAAESVPSRVRTRPRTDYERNLLDFDMSLLAEMRERLSAAGKGADAE